MSLSEGAVQAAVRVAYAHRGYHLNRNNVGVLLDKRGVPVRFGLCNDSAKLNARYKSGDLIGWRSVVITPDMVGQRVAIYTSLECKPEGWTPALSGERFEHEEAQRRWRDLVLSAGGEARFVTGVD